jgi:hypothetical protein
VAGGWGANSAAHVEEKRRNQKVKLIQQHAIKPLKSKNN